MTIQRLRDVDTSQKEAILSLWNNEYPEKLVYKSLKDFENYLVKLSQQIHYLLLDTNGDIKAWATTFVRKNETLFTIIITEQLHGKGLGTQILKKLKEDYNTLNGWVIDHNLDKKLNGKIYTSPLSFYSKNGFKTISDNKIEIEIMSAVKIK